jgi:ADP-heptose:LPS heptosyltransferase
MINKFNPLGIEMKILIVKLSAIGDVIHTLPLLNSIRKHHPDAHITWLRGSCFQSCCKA